MLTACYVAIVSPLRIVNTSESMYPFGKHSCTLNGQKSCTKLFPGGLSPPHIA